MLPIEIITKIFCALHAVSKDTGSSDKSLAKYESPLLVAQVCRAWRAAAIDTAELWQDIVVHLPSPKAIDFILKREGLATRFERAKVPESTNLVIIGHPNHNPHTCSFAQYVMYTYAASVASLVLPYFPPAFVRARQEPPASSMVPARYPYLRALAIRPQTVYPRRNGQFLELSDLHLLTVPWSQLTSLRLANLVVGLSTFCDILPTCTALVTCDIWAIPNLSETTSAVASPTTLAQLEHLSICFQLARADFDTFASISGKYSAFFALFTFPSLKHFALECRVSFPDQLWDDDIMMAFKARSALNLRSLHFCRINIAPAHFINFIDNMPSLSTLEAVESGLPGRRGVDKEFIRALTVKPGVAPRLKEFTFLEAGPVIKFTTEEEAELVKQFVESRTAFTVETNHRRTHLKYLRTNKQIFDRCAGGEEALDSWTERGLVMNLLVPRRS